MKENPVEGHDPSVPYTGSCRLIGDGVVLMFVSLKRLKFVLIS